MPVSILDCTFQQRLFTSLSDGDCCSGVSAFVETNWVSSQAARQE